jgi:hypothetical protein
MNQFMTDEYVLAYHGPLLYEARVCLFIIFIPLLWSLWPNLRECGRGEVRWRIDLTGRELDWAEYVIGHSRTTLLHPLQGVETDVCVSSPSSSTSPPPSPAPFPPPHSPSFSPLLGIRQEGVELTDSWDEWVPEARLLKLNEAGFNKRKQLADQQTQKSRSIGVGGASPAIKEKGKGKKGGETKKRARDSGIESVCVFTLGVTHFPTLGALITLVFVTVLMSRKASTSRNLKSKSLFPMY